MSTIILAAIIFGAVIYITYLRFFKKNHSGGCHDCEEVGCPLVDQAKMMQRNNAKKTD